MDTATKNYIDSLDRRSIPWNRMFTAYGTAEHYNELLSVLEETTDEVQWKKTFTRISDFEHQSTMFPPAPFVHRRVQRCRKHGARAAARPILGSSG